MKHYHVCALALALAAMSCVNDPLSSGTASWTFTWQYTIDELCVNNSDREVASRTRFAGGGSFRVVRTDDDPRSVVPIEDAVVTQGNVAFALRANCDQFVHSLGTVVTQPTWDGPLQLTGAVVDSTDGRDIVRMRITGSTKPAVVRYTMNANGESVDISTPNSIDVPVRFVYTYVGAKVDSTWFSSDRSRLYALSTRMTYNDE